MGENATIELLKGLTENNCNHRIDVCTILQEYISKKMNIRINNGILDVSDLQEEYDALCDTMEVLCLYRRSHDCAIRGDLRYSET